MVSFLSLAEFGRRQAFYSLICFIFPAKILIGIESYSGRNRFSPSLRSDGRKRAVQICWPSIDCAKFSIFLPRRFVRLRFGSPKPNQICKSVFFQRYFIWAVKARLRTALNERRRAEKSFRTETDPNRSFNNQCVTYLCPINTTEWPFPGATESNQLKS